MAGALVTPTSPRLSWSAPVSVGTPAIHAVSCTGPTFCVAEGANGELLQFDGTAWSTSDTGHLPGVGGVSGVRA